MEQNTQSASSLFPFTDFLTSILVNKPNTIAAHVATEALSSYDSPHIFFNDLLANGCVSGMVPSLVYYHQSKSFFDMHYDAIENLREAYFGATGNNVLQDVSGDLKNYLAWFAFEQTAQNIIQEYERL